MAEQIPTALQEEFSLDFFDLFLKNNWDSDFFNKREIEFHSIIALASPEPFPDPVGKIQKFWSFPDVQSTVQRKFSVNAFDDPSRSW